MNVRALNFLALLARYVASSLWLVPLNRVHGIPVCTVVVLRSERVAEKGPNDR